MAAIGGDVQVRIDLGGGADPVFLRLHSSDTLQALARAVEGLLLASNLGSDAGLAWGMEGFNLVDQGSNPARILSLHEEAGKSLQDLGLWPGGNKGNVG